jgi:hypothetical protein
MVAPGVGEAKVTGFVVAPEQIVWRVCGVTPGAGFTVKVNVVLGPEQPLATGVTVYTKLMGVAVLLFQAGLVVIFPEPFTIPVGVIPAGGVVVQL